MNDSQKRWAARAKQALDDVAGMADFLWSVALIGIVAVALMLAFGEVATWILFIPAVLIVTALSIAIRFLWGRSSDRILARLEAPKPESALHRPRPVLRFVLMSRTFGKLVTIMLVVSLVILLAPVFEVAVGDALVGVLILFVLALPLGSLTRLLLRWTGINPADNQRPS